MLLALSWAFLVSLVSGSYACFLLIILGFICEWFLHTSSFLLITLGFTCEWFLHVLVTPWAFFVSLVHGYWLAHHAFGACMSYLLWFKHTPSPLSYIMFVMVTMASSLVIRHGDLGLISCFAVGGGIDTDHVPCDGLSLAVGWGGCHECQWWWWCFGKSLWYMYCLLYLYACSFLSYHSLRCYNLILGVSYPWDFNVPDLSEVPDIPGSSLSKGEEMARS